MASQPQPQPQPQQAQGPAVGSSNNNRNHYNNRRHQQHHYRKRPHHAQRRGRGHFNKKQHLQKNCSECNTASPKYKCPKCRAPYCSIACCRTHKEKSCKQGEDESKVEDDKTKNVANSSTTSNSKYLPCDMLVRDPLLVAKRQRQVTQEEDDLDEGWKITAEMKKSIDNSDWLRNELQDGGLRQVIYEIDCASNKVVDAKTGTTEQEQVLQKAKERYPNFAVFLDKLLVVTGVLERQQETSLEEWLQRSGHGIDNSLGPLMLKPVPKKPRPCWDSKSSSSSEEESTDDDSDSDDSSTTSSGSSSEESSDTDSSTGSNASKT